jgi:hypothetical protein
MRVPLGLAAAVAAAAAAIHPPRNAPQCHALSRPAGHLSSPPRTCGRMVSPSLPQTAFPGCLCPSFAARLVWTRMAAWQKHRQAPFGRSSVTLMLLNSRRLALLPPLFRGNWAGTSMPVFRYACCVAPKLVDGPTLRMPSKGNSSNLPFECSVSFRCVGLPRRPTMGSTADHPTAHQPTLRPRPLDSGVHRLPALH